MMKACEHNRIFCMYQCFARVLHPYLCGSLKPVCPCLAMLYTIALVRCFVQVGNDSDCKMLETSGCSVHLYASCANTQ